MVAAELEIPLRETEKEGRDLICKLFASIGFAFPSLYVALRMSDVHPNADCKMSGARSKGAHARTTWGRSLFTALPCAGKGDRPNELDLAEVQIQVNQESKETLEFDQGTKKYGHLKFGQSICLPPRNSYLVAIQELATRACLLVFCKLLQTFLQTQTLQS